MINKKKKTKFKEIFGKVVEPIALGLLALLFIIPSITVINLEPITKNLKKFTNVLGVTNSSEVIVDLVGGTHEVLNAEKIYRDENGNYKYSAILTKRGSDFYSKPILKIQNRTEDEKTLTFLGSTTTPTQSDIGLIINDQTYRVQDSSGVSETVEILIRPNKEFLVYLTVESLVGIQFSEEFEMDITIN
jgi:hypothetical protein